MTIIIKIIIAIFFIFIFFSLGSALFYLVRGRGKADSTRIVKALTWRIGLSMALFVLLMIAFALGWINPHTI